MRLRLAAICALLLAGLGGCQDLMTNPAIRVLNEQSQALAESRDLDRSAAAVLTDTSVPIVPRAGLGEPIQLTSAQSSGKEQPAKQPNTGLKIPPGLPELPEIKLPKDEKERQAYLKKMFPPLQPVTVDVVPAPGPEGHPLTLADLQGLALRFSPAIKAAESAVVAAQGAVRQSMAYPNPTFSFENDTPQTGTAGYVGFGIDQLIKTGNKLELAGAAAAMDLFNAQLALRKARFDLAYQVRTGYFGVLVAQENVRLSRAFVEFTDRLYEKQVTLLLSGQAALHEPLQLRPFVGQARYNLVQAIEQYHASWRQLTAAIGLADMPPTEVAGRADLPAPEFDHKAVEDRVTNQHTDVLTAKNNIHKAEFNLQLAKVQPIPDVDIHVLVQKDYTTPPFRTGPSVTVGVPIPVWDQNRGAILQAQGQLSQTIHNLPAVQNTLRTTLADAYSRYVTFRAQVVITRQQILDQLRVYQLLYNRFYGGAAKEATSFNDLVVAEQALVGYVTAYVGALGPQWTAITDVANLMQTEDLFKGTHGPDNPDVPLVDQVEGLLHCLPSASPQAAAAHLALP